MAISPAPLGLEFDLTQAGMGKRSKRYSMIVDNGVVKALNVEDKPGVNVSGADTILSSQLPRPAHRPIPRLALERRHALARQFIGALVVIMAGMALDPVPADLVAMERRIEPLPEFDVLHRLLVGGLPAIALPAVDPFGDAVAADIANRCASRPCRAASALRAP